MPSFPSTHPHANAQFFIMLAMIQLCIDFKICKVAIVIYLQTMHSKHRTDQKFGVIETAYKGQTLMSYAAVLKMVENCTANSETKLKMMAYLTNPDAYVNMKHILGQLYALPDSGVLQSFGLHTRYHHVAIAAQKGCLKDPKMDKLLYEKRRLFEGHEPKSFVDIFGGVERFPTVDGMISLFFDPYR